MKKALSFILYTIYTLIIAGLVVLFIAPPLPLIGVVDVKIVKSGSMEPSIMTGSVVMIRESVSYQVGDVITFAEKNDSIPTTHRIVGTEMVDGKEYFLTKGDANSDIDNVLVKYEHIIGKVIVTLPFVGFILDFARQPIGFAFLIGIPAFLIILDEFDKMWQEFRQIRKKKSVKENIYPLVISPYDSQKTQKNQGSRVVSKAVPENMVPKVRLMDIKPIVNEPSPQPLKLKGKTPLRNFYQDIKRPHLTAITSVIVLFTLISVQTWGEISTAYFTDTEASLNNRFQAQALDFSVTPNFKEFEINEFGFVGEGGIDIEVWVSSLIAGNLSFDVSTAYAGGEIEFCENLVANGSVPLPYVGFITGLNGLEIDLSSPWNLNFTLFDSTKYTVGEVCEIDLIFSGYLVNSLGGSGYVVEKKLSLIFRTEIEVVFDEVDFQSFNLDFEEEGGDLEAGSGESLVEEIVEENENQYVEEDEEMIDEEVSDAAGDNEEDEVEEDIEVEVEFLLEVPEPQVGDVDE